MRTRSAMRAVVGGLTEFGDVIDALGCEGRER